MTATDTGHELTALFAHTRAKAPLSPTQRASSSVRRDLSHPSAQIAEFALRKICVAQDLLVQDLLAQDLLAQDLLAQDLHGAESAWH